MAETNIEWTRGANGESGFSFNPWIGCSKVSDGCDHCYAEAWAKRYGTAEWGPGKPRKLTSDANWRQPLKWNKEAAAAGVRARVFCASLADVFDNEVPEEWRARLWNLILMTPHLDWLLLTKRVGNIAKMLPGGWGDGWPHVWIGISVVNQEEADRDIPKLLVLPARIRFLSMEPLLGPVTISRWLKHPVTTGHYGCVVDDSGAAKYFLGPPRLDWVIVGGESGPNARPMHPQWARDLRDQCQLDMVPLFFKQWGEWAPGEHVQDDRHYPVKVLFDNQWHDASDDWMEEQDHGPLMYRIGKKAAGRLLDGRTWDEFPEAA